MKSEPRTARKKPAFVAIADPPHTVISDDDRARFPANEYLFVAGRRTLMLAFGTRMTRLGWLDAGGLQELEMPWYQGCGVHPDGSRVLFVTNRTVCEVVLATGQVTTLAALGGAWDACGCGYGIDDTVAVATGERVVVLRREGPTLVEIASTPVFASGFAVYRGGTIGVCTTVKNAVIAFALTGSGLEQRASFNRKATTTYEVGERIFVTDNKATFELVNV